MAILDQVIPKVKNIDPELGTLLETNKDIAYLGCIAPDIYFLAPDMNDPERAAIDWILGMYDDVVKPLLDAYEKYIKPVEDALGDVVEPVDTTLDQATCNALHQMGDDVNDLVNRSQTAMETLMLDLVAKSVNFFNLFTPPIQLGQKEDQWFWFDMLHYRGTTDYVRNLISAAPRNEPDSGRVLAYAMGHLCHIAADVTGHAFVNEIVGGPYRSFNRRHHIMENFMDVWVHDKFYSEELIGAGLHRRLSDGGIIDQLGTIRTIGDRKCPENLKIVFSSIDAAFRTTYQSVSHPRRITGDFLTQDEINITYWLNVAWLKMSTDCLLTPIETPTQSVMDEINRQMDELRNALGDRPDPPDAPDTCFAFWRDDCDVDFDALEDFVEFLWEGIKYIGKNIRWALNVLKELLETISCFLTAAVVVSVKALLWLVRSWITGMYENFRTSLVISGLALPTIEFLRNHPLGRQFAVSPGSQTPKFYPHRQKKSTLVGGTLFPEETHLTYPTHMPTEGDGTLDGPYAEGLSPMSFIQDTPKDRRIFDLFCRAPEPEATRLAEEESMQNRTAIGNAIDYSVELMLAAYGLWKDQTPLDVPNWNLDSDRGYGYKCWETDDYQRLSPDSNETVRERYTR